jgi:hypothetical protein
MRNDKFESIGQTNCPDSQSLHKPMIGKVLWPWMSLSFICRQATKSLISSGSATPRKDETHDLTVDTLRAIFANWVERLKWIALNEDHYYR